jgi:hypothetical protein
MIKKKVSLSFLGLKNHIPVSPPGNDPRYRSTGWSQMTEQDTNGTTPDRVFLSIKREVKTRPIYDCRCDERLEPTYDEL